MFLFLDVEIVIRGEVRCGASYSVDRLPDAENTEERTLRTSVENPSSPRMRVLLKKRAKRGQSGADKVKDQESRFQWVHIEQSSNYQNLFVLDVSVLSFFIQVSLILGNSQNSMGNPCLSFEDVRAHNSRESCWVVIKNQVWNVTDFLTSHPGGADSKLLTSISAHVV